MHEDAPQDLTMALANRSHSALSAGQQLLDFKFILVNTAGLHSDCDTRMADPRCQVLVQAGVDSVEDFLSLSPRKMWAR